MEFKSYTKCLNGNGIIINKNKWKNLTQFRNDEIVKKDCFLCSWQKDKQQEQSQASDSQ